MRPAQLPPAEDPDAAAAAALAQSVKKQRHPAERIVNQKFWLGWLAVAAAIAMLACLGMMEFVVLCNLLERGLAETDNLLVVLAVSPIVAATAIIVFWLIGVFRGFRETDMDDQFVEAIARRVAAYGSHSP